MPRKKKKSSPTLQKLVPAPEPLIDKNGTQTHRNGEPHQIFLQRWENDWSLRGAERCCCCDCGLEHFYVYEIYKMGDDSWWLNKRPYRLSTDELLGPVRRGDPTKRRRTRK